MAGPGPAGSIGTRRMPLRHYISAAVMLASLVGITIVVHGLAQSRVKYNLHQQVDQDAAQLASRFGQRAGDLLRAFGRMPVPC